MPTAYLSYAPYSALWDFPFRQHHDDVSGKPRELSLANIRSFVDMPPLSPFPSHSAELMTREVVYAGMDTFTVQLNVCENDLRPPITPRNSHGAPRPFLELMKVRERANMCLFLCEMR